MAADEPAYPSCSVVSSINGAPVPLASISPVTTSRDNTASPRPMLSTGGNGSSASAAATIARATSRTSTKSRQVPSGPSTTLPLVRIWSTVRPSSVLGGEPGPVRLKIRSTVASNPSVRARSVSADPASFV